MRTEEEVKSKISRRDVNKNNKTDNVFVVLDMAALVERT